MKVIDLLNKIAKGEEVPKRIKYKNEIRKYVYEDRDYVNSDSSNYYLFYNILTEGKGSDFANALNNEVEIVEEAPEGELTMSEEQVLFNNLDSIDRERIIQLMKILQPPKANVVISIDYSNCGE